MLTFKWSNLSSNSTDLNQTSTIRLILVYIFLNGHKQQFKLCNLPFSVGLKDRLSKASWLNIWFPNVTK